MLIINSARCWRASLTPCSIVSVSGSPKTEKVSAAIPWVRNPFSNGSARFWLRPVTTSARFPNWAAIPSARLIVPAPKMTRPAVPNSNCICLQLVVGGKDVGEFHARARLRHHGFHRVAPHLVVRRLFVRGRSLGAAICLHQHEPGRIILLLEKIEPRDSRFFEAFMRVGQSRVAKHLNEILPYMDVNVND